MTYLVRAKKLLDNRRVVLVGALVLLSGLYMWWSISFWSNYEIREITFRQKTKGQVVSISKLKTETKEQRAEVLDALKRLVSEISSGSSLCTINTIMDWQRILGDLGQREAACKNRETYFSNLRNHLESMIHYLEAEHQLAQILSTAPEGGEVAEADFNKKLEGWKAISKAISELHVDGEVFSPIKQKAQESANSIVNAWQEVVAAHQAKDKSRYVKAEKGLAAAQDTLSGVAEMDEEKLRSLALSLDKALVETRL